MARGHERVRQDLADDPRRAPFVLRVEEAEQEADCHPFDAGVAQLLGGAPHRRLIERRLHGAVRTGDPFAGGEAVSARNDGVALPGHVLRVGEVERPLLAADVHEVAEPLGGQHADPGTGPLDHDVRRDGGAVDHHRDVGRRPPGPGADLQHAADDGDVRVVRRAGDLVRELIARALVPQHQVGEGAADVHPDPAGGAHRAGSLAMSSSAHASTSSNGRVSQSYPRYLRMASAHSGTNVTSPFGPMPAIPSPCCALARSASPSSAVIPSGHTSSTKPRPRRASTPPMRPPGEFTWPVVRSSRISLTAFCTADVAANAGRWRGYSRRTSSQYAGPSRVLVTSCWPMKMRKYMGRSAISGASAASAHAWKWLATSCTVTSRTGTPHCRPATTRITVLMFCELPQPASGVRPTAARVALTASGYEIWTTAEVLPAARRACISFIG